MDFSEIAATLMKVEQECRASFDHLKTISKHDGATAIKSKYVVSLPVRYLTVAVVTDNRIKFGLFLRRK